MHGVSFQDIVAHFPVFVCLWFMVQHERVTRQRDQFIAIVRTLLKAQGSPVDELRAADVMAVEVEKVPAVGSSPIAEPKKLPGE